MPHLRLCLAAALAVALVACSPKAEAPAPEAKAPVAEKATEPAPTKAPAVEPLKATPGTTLYGAKLAEGAAVSIAELLKTPDAHTGKSLLVSGHVRKICKKKGCWMEMAESADETLPGCRVMFKDYGFFVPMDADGAKAKLEGTIEIHTLEKETVTHLESDGGVVANKQADGTAQEIRLIASGGELTL